MKGEITVMAAINKATKGMSPEQVSAFLESLKGLINLKLYHLNGGAK
jgi:hypothetical protein